MKQRLFTIVFFITQFLFSQNFHDTQGKLEVSNAGLATYTLPIAMPPSIMNVGPIINLVYSSGQSSGIAGQGWTINNISTISRVATRHDIDGFRDGVDFDDNDKLALDGQRLLLKSGIYFSNGSTYETEVQSNIKVEYRRVKSTEYFIVTSPDGSRSWYGNYGGTNATDVNAYYITRFEDTNGNFITYHYAKPHLKSLCISEIRFSANTLTNATPLNKIVFTYKLSARKENAYLNGIKIEKVELLDKVEVFTNNLLFRKYQLTHVTDAQGYQRVSQLQEFNGVGEAANPVLFDYYTTGAGASENGAVYTDFLSPTATPDLGGDFDGDGRLDFIAGNQLYYNLFQGSGSVANISIGGIARQKFIATTLTNGKLNQKQSIVYANENIDNIEFKIYNLENNSVVNTYNKVVSLNNSGSCSDVCTELQYDPNGNVLVGPGYPVSKCNSPSFKKNTNKYLEGDFNGDGVSEVLVLGYSESKTYQEDPTGGSGSDPISISIDGEPITTTRYCHWVTYTSNYVSEANVIDLNQSSSTVNSSIGNYSLSNVSLLQGDRRYVMDFNSDGKADILIINNNQTYKVLTFKQLQIAPWGELEVIGEGLLDQYTQTKQILFGDYNGDGKPDIMLPDADGNGCSACVYWHVYYSNPSPAGGAYFVKDTYVITDYYPVPEFNTQWQNSTYYAIDVNKDGKSDLVRVWTNVFQHSAFWDPKDLDTEWSVTSYINNVGVNNTFTLDYSSPWLHTDNDNSRPIPLAGNYKFQGMDNEILVIRYPLGESFNKTITYVDFTKDFNQDNLLKKVTQSGGSIVDEIEYKSVEPDVAKNGLGSLTGFYSSTDSLLYPNVEIKYLPSSKLVSKLLNNSLGVIKKQDFRYHGLSVNLNGLGILGFKKTARSAWYGSISSAKKTWAVTENDPLQRGATAKSYTQLLNPSNPFSFGLSTIGLLSETTSVYNQITDPVSKRYSILLDKQRTTDFLTNVVSEKVYNSYSSDYLLPTSVTSNSYLGTTLQSSTNIVTDYDNVTTGVGSGYYIGRPKEVNTTATLYVNTVTGSPDTKTANEKFFYTNSNLTSTEKKANNAPEAIVETLEYYTNGLLKKKTLSATGTTTANQVSPRSTSYTYEPTNRFVATITDPEGLVSTNLTFHNLYGTVLSQKNAYNQTMTSIYDNWGKRIKITDFLGKSINYTYARTANVYTTTQVGDDGSSSIVESDALARITRVGSKDINGNWNYATTEYDYLGKKIKESEPYASAGSASLWTTYEYDDYSRPIKTIAPSGRTVSTIYNGLTITAIDPVMTKTKTLNTSGQVTSATDNPGGTITFKYDANNNLLESNYDGIKIKAKYDAWSRKIELVDPSAGTYGYSYNAFGETLTETTPKGSTIYTLSPVGKVVTKKVTGLTSSEKTDITSTYSYDSVNKWLTNISVLNPNDGNSSYDYTYDPTTKQVSKTVETFAHVVFTKQFAFDTFGRVDTETSTAVAHSKTSAKTIKTVYKNGVQWQLLDGTTVLWQANTVNSRGQLTSTTLGNGITISNTFDKYGYATQNKHDKGALNVMTLNNVFEPILGNLSSRYNSMFDYKETFTYDSQDRLATWEAPASNILTNLFTTGVEGFTFVGSSGAIANSTGRLKVTAYETESGAKKDILINAVVGKKIKIKFDATIPVNASALVYAKIVETDPSTQDIIAYDLGQINTGTFTTEYVIANYSSISLQYYIVENPNGGNVGIDDGTGGPIIPNITFYIDNLKVDGININVQNYDDRGRITQNNLGEYKYTNTSIAPYQNTSINVTPEAKAYYLNRQTQDISYNSFKSPIEIFESGIDRISFGYNTMQQRSIMYYGGTQVDKLARPFRRYYSGDGSMEVKYTLANNTVEFITYIGGDAYSAPLLLKSDGVATPSYFYLHRDYQGSILAVTNSVGAVVEKRLFDPWGEIVKIQDVAGNNLTKLTFFDRGYTGHEHLQSVGLIHMNGRLYDPKLHRFLQPDNYVQDPYNTQNYNRYGYVLNNPLKYTDPSGEEFTLLGAAIVGATIALVSYLTLSWINHTPITFPGLATSIIMGSVSGAVTSGIGSATNTIANFWVRAGVQALAHGLFQGAVYSISGGNFWNGFASGSISSIASSLWAGGSSFDGNGNAIQGSGFGGIGGTSGASMITFGTIAGGAGAALTGGNFWQGAVTGLVVSGLNHFGHRYEKMKLTRVINSTEEAFDHYYNGFDGEKGVSAVIGDDTVSELLKSDKFIEKYNRIVKGVGNGKVTTKKGSFSIDLTTKTFHAGRTNVDYTVKVLSNGKINVSFKLFVRDGFWDPNAFYEQLGIEIADGMGPNLEFKGGTPYYYNTKIVNYNNLVNPGYKR